MHLTSKVRKAATSGLIAGALLLAGTATASASTPIASYANEPACQAARAIHLVEHPNETTHCEPVTIDDKGTVHYWLMRD
ncbi:hypothetical protein [Amycolatopsis sp. NPDC051903]|uniref:hypothetical protein n=1 Tax=Amycolatopsis sp. NPDC051903 TaxID=3363936 RepID=UPI0037877DFA